MKALQLIDSRNGNAGCRSEGSNSAWQLTDPAEPGSAPATAPLRSLLAFADTAAPREGFAAGDAFSFEDGQHLGRRSGLDGVKERLEALERENREQRAKLDDAAKRNRTLEQELLQAKTAGVSGSRHVELELRREVQSLRGERAELENRLADVRQRQATSGAAEDEVRELRRQLERVREEASTLGSSLAKETLRAQRAEAKAAQAEERGFEEDLGGRRAWTRAGTPKGEVTRGATKGGVTKVSTPSSN